MAVVKAVPGGGELVEITEMVNAGTFWVTATGTAETENWNKPHAQLEMIEMFLASAKLTNVPKHRAPHIQELVAVNHPNTGKWHRGRVQAIKNNDKSLYCVFLIDHGRTVEVSSSAIRDIDDYYKRQEALAYQILLFGIVPGKHAFHSGDCDKLLEAAEWSSEANAFIRNLIFKSSIGYFYKKEKHSNENTLFGDLFVVLEEGFLNLGLLLCMQKYGVSNIHSFMERYSGTSNTLSLPSCTPVVRSKSTSCNYQQPTFTPVSAAVLHTKTLSNHVSLETEREKKYRNRNIQESKQPISERGSKTGLMIKTEKKKKFVQEMFKSNNLNDSLMLHDNVSYAHKSQEIKEKTYTQHIENENLSWKTRDVNSSSETLKFSEMGSKTKSKKHYIIPEERHVESRNSLTYVPKKKSQAHSQREDKYSVRSETWDSESVDVNIPHNGKFIDRNMKGKSLSPEKDSGNRFRPKTIEPTNKDVCDAHKTLPGLSKREDIFSAEHNISWDTKCADEDKAVTKRFMGTQMQINSVSPGKTFRKGKTSPKRVKPIKIDAYGTQQGSQEQSEREDMFSGDSERTFNTKFIGKSNVRNLPLEKTDNKFCTKRLESSNSDVQSTSLQWPRREDKFSPKPVPRDTVAGDEQSACFKSSVREKSVSPNKNFGNKYYPKAIESTNTGTVDAQNKSQRHWRRADKFYKEQDVSGDTDLTTNEVMHNTRTESDVRGNIPARPHQNEFVPRNRRHGSEFASAPSKLSGKYAPQETLPIQSDRDCKSLSSNIHLRTKIKTNPVRTFFPAGYNMAEADKIFAESISPRATEGARSNSCKEMNSCIDDDKKHQNFKGSDQSLAETTHNISSEHKRIVVSNVHTPYTNAKQSNSDVEKKLPLPVCSSGKQKSLVDTTHDISSGHKRIVVSNAHIPHINSEQSNSGMEEKLPVPVCSRGKEKSLRERMLECTLNREETESVSTIEMSKTKEKSLMHNGRTEPHCISSVPNKNSEMFTKLCADGKEILTERQTVEGKKEIEFISDSQTSRSQLSSKLIVNDHNLEVQQDVEVPTNALCEETLSSPQKSETRNSASPLSPEQHLFSAVSDYMTESGCTDVNQSDSLVQLLKQLLASLSSKSQTQVTENPEVKSVGFTEVNAAECTKATATEAVTTKNAGEQELIKNSKLFETSVTIDTDRLPVITTEIQDHFPIGGTKTRPILKILANDALRVMTNKFLDNSEATDISKAKQTDILEFKQMNVSESKTMDVPETKTSDVTESKTMDVPETKTLDVTESKTSDVSESKTSDLSESKTSDLSESKTTNVSEPKATDVSEPKATDVSEAKAMDISEAKAMDISEPKAVGGSESKTMDISESKTMDVPEPKTIDVSEPKTMDVSEPKTMDVSEPKTMDGSESKTIYVSEPKTSDVCESKTMDVSESKTMDVSESKTMEISESKTTDVSELKTMDVLELKTRNISEPKTTEIDISEPKTRDIDVSESKTSDVSESKTSDVSESKTSDVSEFKTMDVSESKTMDVSESKTMDVSESKTMDVSESKTTDISEPKTTDIDVSEPKTTDIDVSEPKTTDIDVSEPKTTDIDVSESKTTDIDVSEFKTTDIDISEYKTMDVSELKTTDVLELKTRDVSENKHIDVSESQALNITETQTSDVLKVKTMGASQSKAMNVVEFSLTENLQGTSAKESGVIMKVSEVTNDMHKDNSMTIATEALVLEDISTEITKTVVNEVADTEHNEARADPTQIMLSDVVKSSEVCEAIPTAADVLPTELVESTSTAPTKSMPAESIKYELAESAPNRHDDLSSAGPIECTSSEMVKSATAEVFDKISVMEKPSLECSGSSNFKDTRYCRSRNNTSALTVKQEIKEEGMSTRAARIINMEPDPCTSLVLNHGRKIMDQLQLMIVMLHGAPDDFRHLNLVTDAPLRRDVHEVLKTIMNRLMRIQKYAWPLIQRGHSCVIVGPPVSGKTLGYVVPLIDQVLLKMESNQIPKGNGPVMLVLCSGSKSCNEIREICYQFLHKSAHRVKMLVTYGGGAEKIEFKLVNGCHILISTPRCFKRLLALGKIVINFHRLKYLVLDEADVLTLRFLPEVEFICKSVERDMKTQDKAQLQVVAVAEKWCPGLEGLIQSLPNPVVCIGAFLEALVYAHLKPHLHFVTKHNRIDVLKDIIDKTARSHRTLVVCREVAEVEDVYRTLDPYPQLLMAHHNMDTSDIHDIYVKWSWVEHPVLVCTDIILQELSFQGASQLVHFSLADLSRKEFAFRCSTLIEQLPSMFESKDTKVLPQMHIFILESDSEPLPTLLRFLKRVNVPVDPDLQKRANIAEVEKEIRKDCVPLCYNTKAFGDCWNRSKCIFRHVIGSTDKPRNIPTSGTVKVKILQAHDACNYSVRILEHVKEYGNPEAVPNLLVSISQKLHSYFKDETHRILLEKSKAHDTCAVEKFRGIYERAEVLAVVKVDRNENPTEVLVRFIDNGCRELVKAEKLFVLPPNLLNIPPQSVEVYLCRLIPCDLDWSWGMVTNEKVAKILSEAEEKGRFLVGKIKLSLGHTMWLDPLECYKNLPTLKTSTIVFSLRRKLLDEQLAVENPQHLQLLYHACTKAGLEVTNFSTSETSSHTERPEEKVEIHWAHLPTDEFSLVYFIVGDHPGRFFIRQQKFEDLVHKLDKKLYKIAKEKNINDRTLFTGDYCIGRFPTDDRWYRARVENAQDDSLDLFFVDHGDRATVSRGEALPLPKELICQLPFQAIECCFAGVSPDLGDRWSEKSIDALYDITAKTGTVDGVKLLYTKVLDKEKPADCTGGYKYHIALIEVSAHGQALLNNTLVAWGLAAQNEKQKQLLKGLDISHLTPPYDFEVSDGSDKEDEQEEMEPRPLSAEEIVFDDRWQIEEPEQNTFENGDNNASASLSCSLGSTSSTEARLEATVANFDFSAVTEDEIMEFFQKTMESYNNQGSKTESLTPSCPDATEGKEEEGPTTGGAHIASERVVQDVEDQKRELSCRQNSQISSSDEEVEYENIHSSSEDDCLMPPLGRMTRTPLVYWRQNAYFVWLRVDLPGVDKYYLKWETDHLHFWTVMGDLVYAFDLDLFGPINPLALKHYGGLFVRIKMQKISVGLDWLRLVVNPEKLSWLKQDYDAGNDSDLEELHISEQLRAVKEMERKKNKIEKGGVLPAHEDPYDDDADDSDSSCSDVMLPGDEQYDPYDPLN